MSLCGSYDCDWAAHIAVFVVNYAMFMMLRFILLFFYATGYFDWCVHVYFRINFKVRIISFILLSTLHAFNKLPIEIIFPIARFFFITGLPGDEEYRFPIFK